MQDKFIISERLINQMAELIDLIKLTELNTAKPFSYKGMLLVFTAFYSNHKEGIHIICAYRAVRIENYSGDVKPLLSNEHHLEVLSGKRERGYSGRLVYIDNQEFVLIGPEIDFYKDPDEAKQVLLF